jgi:hypothetical protein
MAAWEMTEKALRKVCQENSGCVRRVVRRRKNNR